MMIYIEQLLQGAEVEWKKLGEVVEIVTDFTAAGSFASNAKNVTYLKEPSYALLVRTTDLKQRFANSDNFVYVDDHAFNYLWRVNLDNDSIILPNVGNCGEVYYSVPTELPYERCVLGPNALLLRSSIMENKFLFYWFQGADFQYKLSKIISSTGQTKFNKTNLKHIPIPIPPLHVQQEIVRILDKFTELETELEAKLETELELRKQQYERYRDQLLSPDKGLSETEVEWKKLGEVCSIKTGKGVTKKDAATDGRYPIISGGKTPMGYIDVFNRQANTVTVSRVGANAGFVSYITECFYLNDKCFSAVPKESCPVIGRFLYYALKSQEERLSALQSEGGVPTINTRKLGSILIPIPPLSEQQRIVSVLDKFHTLTTSISEGLPRELELRKQQYAYYRDQLLSFER